MPECGCSEDAEILCFRHKIRTVQFGGKPPSPQSQMESRWDKDMPAYKRLRRNGLQPKGIDGSAELESRASDQIEVEMGRIFSKEDLPKAREGMDMAREIRESMDA